MTKIEKTLKELNDLYRFYYKIQKIKPLKVSKLSDGSPSCLTRKKFDSGQSNSTN